MLKADTRYKQIGSRKRALSRWYMIRYRVSNTDTNKNACYAGVSFCLDKEQFIQWFMERDYENCSVDRIDKNKGYSFDNLQIVDKSWNIAKDKLRNNGDEMECRVCKEVKPLSLFVTANNRMYRKTDTICRACEKERCKKKNARISETRSRSSGL